MEDQEKKVEKGQEKVKEQEKGKGQATKKDK